MEKVIKYGPWQKHYFCLECKTWLFARASLFGEICPICGASGSYGIPYTTQIRRVAYTRLPTLFERIFEGKRKEWHWETR